jgi:hypothetical protein
MGSIRKHMALSCNCVNDNNEEEGWVWCYMPVIPATEEA